MSSSAYSIWLHVSLGKHKWWPWAYHPVCGIAQQNMAWKHPPMWSWLRRGCWAVPLLHLCQRLNQSHQCLMLSVVGPKQHCCQQPSLASTCPLLWSQFHEVPAALFIFSSSAHVKIFTSTFILTMLGILFLYWTVAAVSLRTSTLQSGTITPSTCTSSSR